MISAFRARLSNREEYSLLSTSVDSEEALEKDELEILYWAVSDESSTGHIALRTDQKYVSFYPAIRRRYCPLIPVKANIADKREDIKRGKPRRLRLKGFDIAAIDSKAGEFLSSIIEKKWSLLGIGNSKNCAQVVFDLLKVGGLEKFYAFEEDIKLSIAVDAKLKKSVDSLPGEIFICFFSFLLCTTVPLFLISLVSFVVTCAIAGDPHPTVDEFSNPETSEDLACLISGFSTLGAFLLAIVAAAALLWYLLPVTCCSDQRKSHEKAASFLFTPNQVFTILECLQVYSNVESREKFFRYIDHPIAWFKRRVLYEVEVVKKGTGLCFAKYNFSQARERLDACNKLLKACNREYQNLVKAITYEDDRYLCHMFFIKEFIRLSLKDKNRYSAIEDFLQSLSVDAELDKASLELGVTNSELASIASKFKGKLFTDLNVSSNQSSLFYSSSRTQEDEEAPLSEQCNVAYGTT